MKTTQPSICRNEAGILELKPQRTIGSRDPPTEADMEQRRFRADCWKIEDLPRYCELGVAA